MLRDNPPPLNRLLDLEQELKTRRSPAAQKPHPEAPRPTRIKPRASSVKPDPISSPDRQPPQKRCPPSPRPHSSSPWRALAAQLSHDPLMREVEPFTTDNLGSSRFNQKTNRSIHQEIYKASTQRPSTHSPQIFPSAKVSPPSEPTANAFEVAAFNLDDESPVESWQDLAAQLHQARSPHSRYRSSQRFSPTTQIETEPLETEDASYISLPALPIQFEPNSFSAADNSTTHQPTEDFLKTNIEEWDQNDQNLPPFIATVALDDDEPPLESWQDLAAQLHQARSPQPRSSPSLLPAAQPEAESFEIDDFDEFDNFDGLNLPELLTQCESTALSLADTPTVDAFTTDELPQEYLEANVEEWDQDDQEIGSTKTSAIAKVIPASSAIVLADKATKAAIIPFTPAQNPRGSPPQIPTDRDIPTSTTHATTGLSVVEWRSSRWRRFLPWLVFPSWLSLASLLPQFL
ncbi:hypothetical protein NDI52_31205 [Leptolyngbya sp. PL-A3]|uniref:hypothetical protein n=1 Tax=Leptolyngbya sp. PL-A3 TaxID=2933911 RepID=UPI003297B782